MFLIGNLVRALAMVIDTILSLYFFVIIGSVIVSWVSADPYNPIVRFLRMATEPVLHRIRRVLPGFLAGGAGLDFSPLVALLLVQVTRTVVVDSLFSLSRQWR